MADREPIQLENTENKQISRDLALIWKEFDHLVDIEAVAEGKNQ